MRKTISIWWVIAFFACALTAFFWYSSELSATIEELQTKFDEGSVRLNTLQAENAELEATLKTAGTDAFVENQARKEYGYMMSDEIRFIITGQEEYQPEETEPPSP